MRNIAKFVIITGALCCFCGCSKSGNSSGSAQGKMEYSQEGIKLAKIAATSEMESFFEGEKAGSSVDWNQVAHIEGRISAKKLVAEYGENEVAADAKYKGKYVIVDGTVSQVGKDIASDAFITISPSDNFFEGVQAYPVKKKEDAVGQLRKGQKISAVCKIEGQMIGFVVGRECDSDSAYLENVKKQVEADIDAIFTNGKLDNPQSEQLKVLAYYAYLAGSRDTKKACDGHSEKACEQLFASVTNDIKNSKLSEKELVVAKNIGVDPKKINAN